MQSMVFCQAPNNFISIKVRLEQAAENGSRWALKFQFHKGTIRTYNLVVNNFNNQNFNSIKVRLELPNLVTSKVHLIFQFHKGTIRTITISLSIEHLLYFNSIKVRLEHNSVLRRRAVLHISIP